MIFKADKADLLVKIDKLKRKRVNSDDNGTEIKQLNHRFSTKERELVQANEKINNLNEALSKYCTVVNQINKTSDEVEKPLTMTDLLKFANINGASSGSS
jgi:hypothetical protein